PIIVSACLAGVNCRHDGGNKLKPAIAQLVAEGRAIPVCPEQLGGLPTPRVEANLVGGDGDAVLDGTARLATADGRDVTAHFLRGAQEVLHLARLCGARGAILKERSPSCGCCQVWMQGEDGTPRLVAGQGVTAALLRREGIEVVSDEAITDDLLT
ncbi:MAG: DUF523 domain-containing protein, partial [Abditibacteriales bacterium]|nr:DUF523 domain-containing protein [Abditibacteriales bacterium]